MLNYDDDPVKFGEQITNSSQTEENTMGRTFLLTLFGADSCFVMRMDRIK